MSSAGESIEVVATAPPTLGFFFLFASSSIDGRPSSSSSPRKRTRGLALTPLVFMLDFGLDRTETKIGVD